MMKTNSQTLLTRFLSGALFVVVLAGSWDVWWHISLGRETFWQPPHLLLYGATVAAIGSGIYGWYRSREKVWRRVALILVLIPIAAPFDELWHRMFGTESLSSPWIVWSPPHLVLIGAVIGSFALLLPLLRQDRDLQAQRFFGALVFASISNLLFLLCAPIDPLGPFKLLGFWGAGVIAALFVGLLLVAQRWITGMAGATLAATYFLLLVAVQSEGRVYAKVLTIPHAHPPLWLFIFSFLLSAVAVDLSARFPAWLRGLVAGAIIGGVLFGFASSFLLEPSFQYPLSAAFIAIAASLLGGLAAGILVPRLYKPSLTA